LEPCRLKDMTDGRPWYLYLNIEMDQVGTLAQLLPPGIEVYKARPNSGGSFKVFALVKRVNRPVGQVEAEIATVVRRLLGSPAVAPTPSTDEWEQAVTRYLGKLDDRGAGRPRGARDRLAVVDAMLAGQPEQALKRLKEQRQAGAAQADLARQAIWVHAALGNWEEVTALGEEAGRELEGSLHTQRRLGEAWLRRSLTEPEGTSRYEDYLAKAGDCLTVALRLAISQQELQAEASTRQLLAQVRERQFQYREAVHEALRAFVLLGRLEPKDAGAYRSTLVGLLKALGGAVSEPEMAESLFEWLSQVPDLAGPALGALGLSFEALAPEPMAAAALMADGAVGRNWGPDLADVRGRLAGSPAEAGARADKLLDLPDLPEEVEVTLTLYRLLARVQVVGRSEQTLAGLQLLRVHGMEKLTPDDQTLLLAELIRSAAVAHEYPRMCEAEAAFAPGAMPVDLLPLLAEEAVRAEDWESALSYVTRAHEHGLHTHETYLAEASVRLHRKEADLAYEAMGRALEERPDDMATTRKLIETLFMAEDWTYLIRAFNRWQASIHDREVALAEVDLYDYRLAALTGLLDTGQRAEMLQQFAQAASDLIELLMLKKSWVGAAAAYAAAEKQLLAERPDLLLDLAGSLQEGEGECPARAALGYEQVAQAQILKMPRQSVPILREAMLALYVTNPVRYQSMKDMYDQQRAQLLKEPEFGLDGNAGDAEPVADERLAVHGKRIAVVGGDEPVRKAVEQQLRSQGLGDFTHVPPPWEANLSEDQIRQRVQNVDLVVEVTACVKHSTTVALEHVLAKLPNLRRVFASGKGRRSILRAVEEGLKVG